MTEARPVKAIIGLGCKCLRELFLHLVPCRFHPVPQSLVALKPLFAKYGIGNFIKPEILAITVQRPMLSSVLPKKNPIPQWEDLFSDSASAVTTFVDFKRKAGCRW